MRANFFTGLCAGFVIVAVACLVDQNRIHNRDVAQLRELAAVIKQQERYIKVQDQALDECRAKEAGVVSAIGESLPR